MPTTITNEEYMALQKAIENPPTYLHRIAFDACKSREVPIMPELLHLVESLGKVRRTDTVDILTNLLDRYERRMLNIEDEPEAYCEIKSGRTLGTIQLVSYSPEGFKGKTIEMLLDTWIQLGERYAFPKEDE